MFPESHPVVSERGMVRIAIDSEYITVGGPFGRGSVRWYCGQKIPLYVRYVVAWNGRDRVHEIKDFTWEVWNAIKSERTDARAVGGRFS